MQAFQANARCSRSHPSVCTPLPTRISDTHGRHIRIRHIHMPRIAHDQIPTPFLPKSHPPLQTRFHPTSVLWPFQGGVPLHSGRRDDHPESLQASPPPPPFRLRLPFLAPFSSFSSFSSSDSVPCTASDPLPFSFDPLFVTASPLSAFIPACRLGRLLLQVRGSRTAGKPRGATQHSLALPG